VKTIGVLDSGIGGLTFARAIIKKKWNAKLVYISDEDHVPYGDKSTAWLMKRVEQMIDQLKAQGVDMVLMACNTMTVHTIESMRKCFDLPLFGVEPFLNHPKKYPPTQHECRSYALILTQATANASKFQSLKQQLDPENAIDVFVLENLARWIQGLSQSNISQLEPKLYDEIAPLLGKGYTHLILGCTHYALVGAWLSKALNITLVDPTDHVLTFMETQGDIEKGQVENMFQYSANLGKSWQKVTLEEDFDFVV